MIQPTPPVDPSQMSLPLRNRVQMTACRNVEARWNPTNIRTATAELRVGNCREYQRVEEFEVRWITSGGTVGKKEKREHRERCGKARNSR